MARVWRDGQKKQCYIYRLIVVFFLPIRGIVDGGKGGVCIVGGGRHCASVAIWTEETVLHLSAHCGKLGQCVRRRSRYKFVAVLI